MSDLSTKPLTLSPDSYELAICDLILNLTERNLSCGRKYVSRKELGIPITEVLKVMSRDVLQHMPLWCEKKFTVFTISTEFSNLLIGPRILLYWLNTFFKHSQPNNLIQSNQQILSEGITLQNRGFQSILFHSE